MKKPCSVYIFKDFDSEKKKANSIRATHRLDCEFYHNNCTTTSLTKKGEHPLYIYENKKGMLFLYQNPTNKVLNKRYSNKAEYCLTGNSMNLSSLYTEYDDEKVQYAYGFPNKKDMNTLLKENGFNPQYDYTKEAYIFIGSYGDDKLNRRFEYLEVYVFSNARDEIENIYNLAIDGEYDEWFQIYREKANLQPYFTYNNSSGSSQLNFDYEE